MGAWQESEMYKINYNTLSTYSGWIHPNVFWKLMKNNVLTSKQIYDCLTSDVKTYDSLVEKMYAKYPGQAGAIEQAFHDSNIYPNVEKPLTDDVYLMNKTISASTTVTGQNMIVQNVIVNNNATLTLKAEKSLTINAPFIVEKGSQFTFLR